MNHGSLFSGIGGFDLGFERAGIQTVWQVEIDDYCRRVLARHFPSAQRYDDVRTVGKHNLAPVDIISGGFPCQDISNAGKRAGIGGERSGLWGEMFRVVCELRPRLLTVENVAALLSDGMGRVLGDLASVGYDAEWDCFRAAEFGAPHERDRVFIISYPHEHRLEAHPNETFLRHALRNPRSDGYVGAMGSASIWSEPRPIGARPMGMGNGIPSDVDRLRGLGNAIVPQIAEWIGRRIVSDFSPSTVDGAVCPKPMG
jgi:DNA (cytosine-5)-methyltransferase 1